MYICIMRLPFYISWTAAQKHMEAEEQVPRDVNDYLQLGSAESRMNVAYVEAVLREELNTGIPIEALVESCMSCKSLRRILSVYNRAKL